MNMLVGNDFIPHLPFMHINKGSLQKFYEAYLRAMPEMNGYMNDHGELHIDRFMIFVRHIAQAERELMSEAREDDEWLMSKQRTGPIDSDDIWDNIAADEENGGDAEYLFGNDENNDQPVNGGGAVRSVLKRPAKLTAEETEKAQQREFDTFASDIRYNYYKKKFCLLEPSDDDVKVIAHELVRALVWNLGYYYSGVQSWDWFYPYHYSPYASDIWRVCSAEQFRDVDFPDRGRPFMPFEQLMAVLPARSKPCLPLKLQRLFNAGSPIYDFYPTDFLQVCVQFFNVVSDTAGQCLVKFVQFVVCTARRTWMTSRTTGKLLFVCRSWTNGGWCAPLRTFCRSCLTKKNAETPFSRRLFTPTWVVKKFAAR